MRTGEGWWYLTVILDLYNREVVGWSVSRGLKAYQTTIPALKQATGRFGARAGLLFHSYRGVQYACHNFQWLSKEHGITASMSGKGNCILKLLS